MSIHRLVLCIVSLSLVIVSGCGADAEQEGEGLGVTEGSSDTGTSNATDTSSSPSEGDDVVQGRDAGPPRTDTSRTQDGEARDQMDTPSYANDTSSPEDSRPIDTDTPDMEPDTEPSVDVTPVPDTSMDTGRDVMRDTRPNPDALPSQFGPGSFINSLTVKQSSAIGSLFQLTSQFQPGLNPNATINNRIKSGQLVYLFEYEGWNDLKNDTTMSLYLHPGSDANTSNGFTPNLMGNGIFEIDPASYGAQGTPQAELSNASVTASQLQAQGGSVQLAIPVGTGVSPFNVRIRDAVVEANVVTPKGKTQPGAGVALEKGSLSGQVPKENLKTLLNRVFDSRCRCGTSDYLKLKQGKLQCNPSRTCSGGSPLCSQCSIIRSLIDGSADIDTNNDGTNDAYSFEASFEAVVADIVGVSSP